MKRINFETSAAFICGVVLVLMAFLEYAFNDFAVASLFGALKDIAGTGVVFVVYVAAVKNLKENSRKNHEKLRYLDELEKNKKDIHRAADISAYYKTIFYGMQVLIYNGEIQDMLTKVKHSLDRPTIGKECRAVLLCVRDVLSFFADTEYFAKGLSDDEYEKRLDWLAPDNKEWIKHFRCIKDKDLAAWCNIQRADTLELIIENRVKRVGYDEKLIIAALEQCFETVRLINQQVESNSEDQRYALLYRSYVNRNIAVLYELMGDKERCADYARETLQNRKELFEHYESVDGYTDVMEDHIAHEYLLAMVEYYSVEQNVAIKEEIKQTSLNLYQNWKHKIGLQQKIFEKVELSIKEFN